MGFPRTAIGYTFFTHLLLASRMLTKNTDPTFPIPKSLPDTLPAATPCPYQMLCRSGQRF